MGLRRIHTTDEPALHKVCKTVTSFDWRLRKLLDDMRETLIDSNGVGLAAPQVGILKRVVLVDTGDEILELINPEMLETSGEQTGLEGCLSVPGKYGIVTRPMYAKVRAQDRNGDWYEAEGEELIARCFCHELDHLDGIVYTEKMERFLTDEELYDQWRIRNIGWYLDYGASPVSGQKMPFSQRNLLRNIIETADTVTQTQATLRFGHEVCVMPLACLLELDNCGMAVKDLDNLDTYWRNYRIFPMGSNIQLIFYRPKKGKTGDILVKALLNEREAYMPTSTDSWPYYKWQDLRQYYLDKLNKFEAENRKL